MLREAESLVPGPVQLSVATKGTRRPAEQTALDRPLSGKQPQLVHLSDGIVSALGERRQRLGNLVKGWSGTKEKKETLPGSSHTSKEGEEARQPGTVSSVPPAPHPGPS